MKSIHDSRVVLFVAHREGTVIHSDPDMMGHLGDHYAAWSMEAFEPYNGEIILANK
jgi:hypothetical protein